jgi:hypothetical protein
MSTLTLNLPEALLREANRFVTARGKTLSQYMIESLERDITEASPPASEYGTPEEIHAALHSPTRPNKESFALSREKYNLPDLSHLTSEEIADQADAIVARLSPERVAELEREGIL